MRWARSSLRPLRGLRPGDVLVRGRVVRLGQPEMTLPRPAPPGAPPLERMAVAVVDVESFPWMERPRRERHERVRPFTIADGSGTALVAFPEESRSSLEVCLAAPCVEVVDGEETVLLRSLVVGQEVVVRGLARLEVDRDGTASVGEAYREAPLVPVIEARAVLDEAAWAQRTGAAFPWIAWVLRLLRRGRAVGPW